jgi:hypothetical protein
MFQQAMATRVLRGASVFCLHFGLDEADDIIMEAAEEGWSLNAATTSQTPSKTVITEVWGRGELLEVKRSG